MDKSRKKNAILNTSVAIITQLLTIIFSFVSRYVFLKYLGEELLGVNSLFSEVLIFFTLADLGLSTALAFCLYKPISDNDDKRIQGYLSFFKKKYRYVVVLLILISFAFVPFLSFIKTDIVLKDLIKYYFFYAISNLIGYFFIYNETYVVANQDERLISIVNLFFNLVQSIVQIIVLVALKKYIYYISVPAIFAVLRKYFLQLIIRKKYPIVILPKNADSLLKDEKQEFTRKSNSLFIHKIGNLAINQTDGMIISYMIGVRQLGILSNYLVIKSTIVNLTSKIYTSILPSFGNYLATENKERSNDLFYYYDFLNYWLFYFCTIALYCLSSDFIELIFGKEMILESPPLLCLFIAFFLDGLRNPVSAFREATGEYERDKWFTIVAAFTNLITSILFARIWGLSGIFVGTVCSMIVLIVSRTLIFFKDLNRSKEYFCHIFLGFLWLLLSLGFTSTICSLIKSLVINKMLSFIIEILSVIVVSSVLFVILNFRNKHFVRILSTVLAYTRKRGINE